MTAELAELQALWLDLRAHVDRLADERQQYQEFFEQASEAYVITDVRGTIIEVNGAAVDILQRRKRYLRGKPITALIALEKRAQFRERLHALCEHETHAEPSWRTIFVAAQVRIDVALTARPIERRSGMGGVCWRLEALA